MKLSDDEFKDLSIELTNKTNMLIANTMESLESETHIRDDIVCIVLSSLIMCVGNLFVLLKQEENVDTWDLLEKFYQKTKIYMLEHNIPMKFN